MATAKKNTTAPTRTKKEETKATPAPAPAPEPETQETDAPATISDEMITATDELNNILGLSPEIDTGSEPEIFEKAFNEGAALIAETDEADFTPETWNWLKEQGYLDHLKKAEPEKPTKAAKASGTKTPKAPAAPKEAKYTRVKALADAILTEGTIKDLAKTSDANYTANGGKTNMNIASWDAGFGKNLLLLLGLAEEKDGKLILLKK